MGGGCLSPKQKIVEVYIDMINTIHEEAVNLDKQRQGKLELLSQKVAKNGYLKKLIDYLGYHRGQISQAMLLNYMIMQREKNFTSKKAGLFVCDHIITAIFKKETEFKRQSIKKSLKVIDTSFSKSAVTEQSRHSKCQQNGNVSLVMGQLGRMDEIYINTVYFILKNEQKLFCQTLTSMQNYSWQRSHVQNIVKNVNSNIKQKGNLILQILIKKMMKGQQKQNSIKAYAALIKNIKFYSNSSNDLTALAFFLKQCTLKTSSEFQSQQIVKDYINYLIGNHTTSIYQLIFQIYDDCRFQHQPLLQELIIQVTRDHDLRVQFLRGLFLYLLGYVGWCGETKLQTRWNLLYPSITVEGKGYKHITEIQTKINALNTLKTWLQYEFVDINEIMLYNHQMLIYAFLLNVNEQIMKNNNELCNQIMRIFSQCCPSCQDSELTVVSKIQIINLMIEQLNWVHADENYQQLIIEYIGEFLNQIEYFQSQKHISIQGLTSNLNEKNKLKIAQINIEILKKVPSHLLSEYFQQQGIGSYLHSAYQNLLLTKCNPIFKLQLIDLIVQSSRVLNQKQQKSVLYAYLQTINQVHNNYFIALLIVLIKSIFITSTISHKLQQIRKKIQQNGTITPAIQESITELFANQHQNPIQINDIQIQLNDGLYEAHKQSFSNMFNQQTSINKQQQLQQNNIFMCKNSILSHQNQESEGSFYEILSIIKK